ncbi:hypothetical protein KY312_00955, partial [Candidatus Woesearchaeota archaeon]|nr:hypothetical protein [Candidatus Woesearchaeota archaeon]
MEQTIEEKLYQDELNEIREQYVESGNERKAKSRLSKWVSEFVENNPKENAKRVILNSQISAQRKYDRAETEWQKLLKRGKVLARRYDVAEELMLAADARTSEVYIELEKFI